MTEQSHDPETIIARYAEGPTQLKAAIAGLSESELDVAHSADTWTIRQIVHHIADGDDIWKIAIKAALGNSSGAFSLSWYWDKPQDEWVESWHYAGRTIELSLALFDANRRHIVQLLQHIPDAWGRHIFIRWPDGENVQTTVVYIVGMQANHVSDHINDIRMIRQTHNI
jgi:uncharacterized damage-inducible protein DinB